MDSARGASYNHADRGHRFFGLRPTLTVFGVHDEEASMKITAGISAVSLALALGLAGCGDSGDMDESQDMMEDTTGAMTNHADDAGQGSDAMMSPESSPAEPEPAPAGDQ